MVYHSDEIPLDIGFSLTGLLSMHCVYWNFDTIKIVLSWYKATFPIFKNRAYFCVTSIALNDGNIRGGNVIKTFAQEISTRQKFEIVSLLQIKGKWVRKLWICDSCMLNVCFREYSMPSTFVKMSHYKSEENICSVYKCALYKVCNLLNLER